MTTALPWPALIGAKSIQWSQRAAAAETPRSQAGVQQVVTNDSGYWAALATFVIGEEARVLQWRALASKMRGRAVPVLLPAFDRYRPAGDSGQRLPHVEPVPFARAPDGRPLFRRNGTGRVIVTPATVQVAANAAARATRITLEPVTAGNVWTVPTPGQYFTIGERLYIVERYWQALSTDPVTVDIWPPLRAAAAEGDEVITHRPVCRMRATDPTTLWPLLERGWSGEVQIAFEEAL